MPLTRTCPRCGTALPADGWEGLCPQCLVRVSLEGGAERGSPQPQQPSPLTGNRISNPPSAFHAAALGDAGVPIMRRFGDYELLEEIARGGMGVVFKARQASLNRIVAVKMILAGQLASEAAVHRFRTEAEAAANLQHPNIVAIHEVGEHDRQQYFSMDYIKGRNLAELAREGPLPARQAALYLKTIAEAIHFAHQRGILHRDLKPSNVLLDSFDQTRVTDFGLAKRLSNSELGTRNSELTLTGQVLGSPNFMPPEQAASKHGRVGPHS